MNLSWFENAPKDLPYLVAVSGGLDSMALLRILSEHQFAKIIVCHLNHGLRDEEADADQQLVEDTTKFLGFTFLCEKINLKVVIAEEGISLETAGREARYDFFSRCANVTNADTVLLGHHADDQAETILWNLMRGSRGSRGMAEVSARAELTLVRPLLKTRKSELRAWMETHDFPWREDLSNQICDVARNRIRNEVIPLIEDISKRDSVVLINRSFVEDQETEILREWSAGQIEYLDPQGRIYLPIVRGLPRELQRFIFRKFLTSQGIGDLDYQLLEGCLGLVNGSDDHSLNLPGGHWLRRKENRIFVKRSDGDSN